MRIHFYLHIRRNQNNKDADGKGGLAYEQGYAYINRHREIVVF